MSTTLHLETTILPGHRLEISDPGLPEGATVAVTVQVPDPVAQPRLSMIEFLTSLPAGPRAAPTWAAYERHLQEEKAAWDR